MNKHQQVWMVVRIAVRRILGHFHEPPSPPTCPPRTVPLQQLLTETLKSTGSLLVPAPVVVAVVVVVVVVVEQVKLPQHRSCSGGSRSNPVLLLLPATTLLRLCLSNQRRKAVGKPVIHSQPSHSHQPRHPPPSRTTAPAKQGSGIRCCSSQPGGRPGPLSQPQQASR